MHHAGAAWANPFPDSRQPQETHRQTGFTGQGVSPRRYVLQLMTSGLSHGDPSETSEF